MPGLSAPWWLLLLPLVGLVLIRRRPRPSVPFSCLSRLPEPSPGRRWLAALPARLEAIGLTLVVVALAGPFWPRPGVRIPTEGIALMMVLDCSGSMAEPFAGTDPSLPTRLDAAKQAFRLFILGGTANDGTTFPGRPQDLVGLIAFGTFADDVCPLTLSHTVWGQLLDGVEAKIGPDVGSTNIGDALAEALLRLAAGNRSRRGVIVLVSDGEQTVPPPALLPRQAARLAAARQVPIYTIDAAGRVDSRDAKAVEARQVGRQTLQELAALTSGRYFEADDAHGFRNALEQIDQRERHESPSHQHLRQLNLSGWFAGSAFVFLVLGAVLSMSLAQRVSEPC